MKKNKKSGPLIVGIAGASGSGKSYLAEYIKSGFTDKTCIILSQDHYYRDRSDLSIELRQQINYDHPDAIEFSLLHEHLKKLRRRTAINHPLYNFTNHNREKETTQVLPAEVIIVEGILIFAIKKILPVFDLKIYVDTPPDICFIRRLQRDTIERGRTAESVIEQYQKTVRKMFIQYVYPSRKHADIIITAEEKTCNEYVDILKTVKAMVKMSGATP